MIGWTRNRGRWLLLSVFLVWQCVLMPADLFSAEPTRSASYEYDVKAVFLHHFTHYLEGLDEGVSDTFNIVVAGESEIVVPLKKIAARKKVAEKAIDVRQYMSEDDLQDCHMLFISKSAGDLLSELVELAERNGVLTISELDKSNDFGTAINFVMRGGKIKFEINREAMKKIGVRPGSQLLKLAILVR